MYFVYNAVLTNTSSDDLCITSLSTIAIEEVNNLIYGLCIIIYVTIVLLIYHGGSPVIKEFNAPCMGQL